MSLPSFIQLANTFGQWVGVTNNLISHVDNTSAYILVAQNATPRVSAGNVSINGVITVANSTNSTSITPLSLTVGTTVVNTSATSLGGTLSVSGATNALGTMGISGAVNALSVAGFSGAVNTFSTVGFGGAANALSTMGFSGAVNTFSTVGLGGAVNALSTLGVTGTLTALGQLAVTANANFNSGTLFVDATNNRIGINNTAPKYAVVVNGITALKSVSETTTISAISANGTINFDAATQGVMFYTTNAFANWTLNLRGNSTAALNSLMSTGDSMTFTFLVNQGATAYYASAHQIDGSSVTPKWQGGSAPFAGNPSSSDVYTYTVIKTADTPTWTVLASRTKYA